MVALDWSEYLVSLSANQSEIGRAAGVSSGTVSRWFSKQTVPDAGAVVAVARAFGQSPTHALVAAGYLTPDEVERSRPGHPALRLGDFSSRELARELSRRLDASQLTSPRGRTKLELSREIVGQFTALQVDEKYTEMLELVDSIEVMPHQADEPSMAQMTAMCLRALDAWAVDPRMKKIVRSPEVYEWVWECKHAMWELVDAVQRAEAAEWAAEATEVRGHRVVMMAAMSVVAGVLITAVNESADTLDEAERKLFAIADEVVALG